MSLFNRVKNMHRHTDKSAPGAVSNASHNDSARYDSNSNVRDDHSYSQDGQSGHHSSQTRTRNDGGSWYKRRSSAINQPPPPPPPKHNVSLPGTTPSGPVEPFPSQAPAGQFGKGLWSWIFHVKQSSADATVIDQVKGLFFDAEQFVNNFYSRRRYQDEVPNDVLDQVNCSTSMSTAELQEYLRTTNLHNPIITHVLINLLLGLIAFDSMDSEESLLPREFQNYMVLAKARTRSTSPKNREHEVQPALSSYRVLTAFLRSDIKNDQNYLRERNQVIENVASRFDTAFQYWATSKRSQDERYKMLRRVFENAANLGIFLFSEPAVYVFNWEKKPSGISDGHIAISPRLLRAYDNDGRWKEIADHMIPIRLGPVIDNSMRNPVKTVSTEYDVSAMDTGSSSYTETNSTINQFSSNGGSKDNTLETDATSVQQRITRKKVMVRENEKAANMSDLDSQSNETSSSLSSNKHGDRIGSEDPFKAETDDPPIFQQHSSLDPTRSANNNSDLPNSLRPGSHSNQVYQAVTLHPDHPQLSPNRTVRPQEPPLSSYEFSETKSRRPGTSRRESVDLYERTAPPSNYVSQPENQQWFGDDRRRHTNSLPQDDSGRHNMRGPAGPRAAPRPMPLPSDYPLVSRNMHEQPTSKAKRSGSTRRSSRSSSPPAPSALQSRGSYTVSSYDGWPSQNSYSAPSYHYYNQQDQPRSTARSQMSSAMEPQSQDGEETGGGRRRSHSRRARSESPRRTINRSRAAPRQDRTRPPQAYTHTNI